MLVLECWCWSQERCAGDNGRRERGKGAGGKERRLVPRISDVIQKEEGIYVCAGTVRVPVEHLPLHILRGRAPSCLATCRP